MFDIGFWEMLMILGLALILLGPERLPRVARTLGSWVGHARALVRHLQIQIDEELREQKEAVLGTEEEEKEKPESHES